MKRKLLVLVLVLAFVISTFAALGVSGASACPDLTTPGGQVVIGPAEATGGAVTAFTVITTQGPGEIPIDLDFDCF